MIRPNGWEARLAEQLREAAARPYHPKHWNCARFAHSCAEAVSGSLLPFRWHGSLAASADAVLERVEPRQARSGDVVLSNVPEPSLGVCTGRAATFLTLHGLLTIPRSRVIAAWSI